MCYDYYTMSQIPLLDFVLFRITLVYIVNGQCDYFVYMSTFVYITSSFCQQITHSISAIFVLNKFDLI